MASSDNQALLLQVSADLSKLEKAFQRSQGVIEKSTDSMVRRAKKAADSMEGSLGKMNLAGALDKVFDSSRIKVLDSGAAKISVFGSALEELGPAGIAAAGGIAAVFAAFAGAREAARFADDIGDTADRLHVTTDALQEYRYAVRAAGGEEAGADEALESFSVTLGKAQQGLAKGQRAFLALGFTKAQIKGFTDAGDALNQVTQRISGLPAAQQDAIIQQLGLDGIKPLIAKGTEEMVRLRNEAHKVGVVMDSELVARGGALNDQFETIAKVIDVQLKSALVDLGPVLVQLLQLAADFSKELSLEVQTLEALSQTGLKGIQVQLNAREFGKQNGLRGQDLNTYAAKEVINFARAQKLDSAEMAQRFVNKVGGSKDARNLIDTSQGAKHQDHTQASLESAMNGAQRTLLQTMLGLTDDIQSRAAIQKQLVDLDQKGRDQELARQVEEVKANDNLSAAQKAQALATIAATKATEAEAFAAEKRRIDAEALIATQHKRVDHEKDLIDAQVNELRAREDLTTSVFERGRIEQQIADLEKKKADLDASQSVKDQQTRANAATGDQSTIIVGDPSVQKARDRAFAAQNDVRALDLLGPLDQWTRGIKSANQAMQEATVEGLDELNSSLAKTVVEGGKASDVLHQFLNRLLEDILQNQFQQAEKGAFDIFKSIFGGGKAVGGPVKAGKSYTINENGQEMFFPGVDGSIVSNARLNRMFQGVMEAKQSRPSVYAPQFDLRGAVMTQDLLNQMNAMSNQSAVQGTLGGAQLSAVQSARIKRNTFN